MLNFSFLSSLGINSRRPTSVFRRMRFCLATRNAQCLTDDPESSLLRSAKPFLDFAKGMKVKFWRPLMKFSKTDDAFVRYSTKNFDVDDGGAVTAVK